MKTLFGVIHPDSGDIFIEGQKVEIDSPIQAKKAGIALAPEDRKREGLVMGMSLSDNISLANLKEIATCGHIKKRVSTGLSLKYISELKIKPGDPKKKILNFSGGNQQKAVIAKWLATNPKVIILDEPTRGIDIGAKVEIYNLINELAARGVGIIVVSSELPELIGICNRILVISNGGITGEFERNAFQQDVLMKAATRFEQQ